MSKEQNIFIPALVAGGVLLMGTIFALSSIMDYPKTKKRLARQQRNLQKLYALSEDFKTLDAQLLPLKKKDETDNTLPDIKKLAEDAFTKEKIDACKQETENTVAGFKLQKIELELHNISLSKLQDFISDMERRHPPVRLVSCDLTAVPGFPAQANAKLQMRYIYAGSTP